MSDSINTNHSDKLDHIREVAMTVREPRNAGEIAETAGVARNTAEKYLEQLVEMDKLGIEERGRETCYYPDPVTQYLDHVRNLVEGNTKDELTAELAAIRDDIDSWKDQYEVSSPDELRASIGNDSVSATERTQRMRDAEDWEYYLHQAELIEQALQLYDPLEGASNARLESAV
jgi:predicted ArsR family transcriptional regulator